MTPGHTNFPPGLPAQNAAWNETQNPARILALGAGLCLVLTRFSELHQVMTYLTGVNFRLLYVFGLPALAGVALSGGFQRTLRGWPARYWTGYLLWMAAAVVFSSWRASSLEHVLNYAMKDFIMLFVIGGLVSTWKECRMLMYALAWAGVLSVANGKLFSDPNSLGRLSLDFGTMANANDYACHLLAVLPFVLWPALKPQSWPLTRPAALGVAGVGLFLLLHTGSRGGAVGLAAAALFFLWRASGRQRTALLVVGPLALALAIGAAPADALRRIRSLWDAGDSTEALGSATARKYVLGKSVEYTFQRPLFGVGPGQFPNYEGRHERVKGTRGYYHGTHNTFTQVSSESGIPGLIFFVAGLISSYRLLAATWRKARARPGCEDIRSVAFAVMLSMAGFTVGMTFLNFAYFFYMPAFGGLAIAISRAAEEEFRQRTPARRDGWWITGGPVWPRNRRAGVVAP